MTNKRNTLLFNEFLQITRAINRQFSAEPLLYGSLGLSKIIEKGIVAEDIDILLPNEYLDEKWTLLCLLMCEKGYELIDLHEHTFQKMIENEDIPVSFAKNDFSDFAKIEPSECPSFFDSGARFQSLNLSQFLKVYEQSMRDSYRQHKKNDADALKISLIKEKLQCL